MKIGVITDCLKMKDLPSALDEAHALGLNGVQIYATLGKFSPDMSEEEKAFIKAKLKEDHLEVSALCGDMGGCGFHDAKLNPERIERTKRIVDLAKEFGSHVVTTHIGVIPEDPNEPRYQVMLDALTACGLYAKEQGVTLAIETGPEYPKTLLGFLQKTKGGVGVNLDPANLIMIGGSDPADAVRLLAPYIVHTHAKDGINLIKVHPGDVYMGFIEGGEKATWACATYKEVPLGQGSVPWKRYLEALREIGYNGYLTIEYEAKGDAKKEIEGAVSFLREQLKEIGA